MNKLFFWIIIGLFLSLYQTSFADIEEEAAATAFDQDVINEPNALEEFTNGVHLQVALDELEYVLKQHGNEAALSQLEDFKEKLSKEISADEIQPYYLTKIAVNTMVFALLSTVVLTPLVCCTLCAASLKVIWTKARKDHLD